jgi:hypothetical protein
MTKLRNPDRGSRRPYTYQIVLQGHLGQQWTEWFGEFSITLEPHGYTILTGPVTDQAALHGLLKKIRDLGIPLIAVYRLERHEDSASSSSP